MIIKKETVVIKTSKGPIHGTITTHQLDDKKTKMMLRYEY